MFLCFCISVFLYFCEHRSLTTPLTTHPSPFTTHLLFITRVNNYLQLPPAGAKKASSSGGRGGGKGGKGGRGGRGGRGGKGKGRGGKGKGR